jgi:hypothetical protein
MNLSSFDTNTAAAVLLRWITATSQSSDVFQQRHHSVARSSNHERVSIVTSAQSYPHATNEVSMVALW